MFLGLKIFIKNLFDIILTNSGLIAWSLNFLVINFLINFLLILLVKIILKNLVNINFKFYSTFRYVFKDASFLVNKKFYRNLLIFTTLNFILSILQVIFICIHMDYIYIVYFYLVSIYLFITIYILFSYNNNIYLIINEYVKIFYFFLYVYRNYIKYFYIKHYNIYSLNIKICISITINIQLIYYFFLINTEKNILISYLLIYSWSFLILNLTILSINLVFRLYNRFVFINNIIYDIVYSKFEYLVCIITKKLVYFYKTSAYLNIKIYTYIYIIITPLIFIINIDIQNWFILLNIINILSFFFIKKNKILLTFVFLFSVLYSILLLQYLHGIVPLLFFSITFCRFYFNIKYNIFNMFFAISTLYISFLNIYILVIIKINLFVFYKIFFFKKIKEINFFYKYKSLFFSKYLRNNLVLDYIIILNLIYYINLYNLIICTVYFILYFLILSINCNFLIIKKKLISLYTHTYKLVLIFVLYIVIVLLLLNLLYIYDFNVFVFALLLFLIIIFILFQIFIIILMSKKRILFYLSILFIQIVMCLKLYLLIMLVITLNVLIYIFIFKIYSQLSSKNNSNILFNFFLIVHIIILYSLFLLFSLTLLYSYQDGLLFYDNIITVLFYFIIFAYILIILKFLKLIQKQFCYLYNNCELKKKFDLLFFGNINITTLILIAFLFLFVYSVTKYFNYKILNNFIFLYYIFIYTYVNDFILNFNYKKKHKTIILNFVANLIYIYLLDLSYLYYIIVVLINLFFYIYFFTNLFYYIKKHFNSRNKYTLLKLFIYVFNIICILLFYGFINIAYFIIIMTIVIIILFLDNYSLFFFKLCVFICLFYLYLSINYNNVYSLVFNLFLVLYTGVVHNIKIYNYYNFIIILVIILLNKIFYLIPLLIAVQYIIFFFYISYVYIDNKKLKKVFPNFKKYINKNILVINLSIIYLLFIYSVYNLNLLIFFSFIMYVLFIVCVLKFKFILINDGGFLFNLFLILLATASHFIIACFTALSMLFLNNTSLLIPFLLYFIDMYLFFFLLIKLIVKVIFYFVKFFTFVSKQNINIRLDKIFIFFINFIIIIYIFLLYTLCYSNYIFYLIFNVFIFIYIYGVVLFTIYALINYNIKSDFICLFLNFFLTFSLFLFFKDNSIILIGFCIRLYIYNIYYRYISSFVIYTINKLKLYFFKIIITYNTILFISTTVYYGNIQFIFTHVFLFVVVVTVLLLAFIYYLLNYYEQTIIVLDHVILFLLLSIIYYNIDLILLYLIVKFPMFYYFLIEFRNS